MKTCKICQQTKEDSDFRKKKEKYFLNTCKKCDNRKGKLYYRQKREKLITQLDGIKISLGCCCCGWKTFPEGLDLHHLNPNIKVSTIANLLNRGQHSFPKIYREISKCCVLCANCHRGLHNGRIVLPDNPPQINLQPASRDCP